MGRRRKGERRRYEVTTLWGRHHEMIRLIVLGFNNKEIGTILGVTPQNVSDLRNSEVAKAKIEMLTVARDSDTVDVSRVLVSDAEKSLELLQKVRDGELTDDIRLRVSTAQDLLSRGGHPRVQKVQGSVAHALVTPETLDRIKARRTAVEAEIIEEEETGGVAGQEGETLTEDGNEIL